jgi:hypothetical protein
MNNVNLTTFCGYVRSLLKSASSLHIVPPACRFPISNKSDVLNDCCKIIRIIFYANVNVLGVYLNRRKLKLRSTHPDVKTSSTHYENKVCIHTGKMDLLFAVQL